MTTARIRTVAGLTLLLGATVGAQNHAVLRQDADGMKRKITAIQGRHVARPRQAVRTPISENELNAYLAYEMGDGLPTGIVEPRVTILGPGRVSGEGHRRSRSGAPRAESRPASSIRCYYLTGRVPVAATGMLRTSRGVGRVRVRVGRRRRGAGSEAGAAADRHPLLTDGRTTRRHQASTIRSRCRRDIQEIQVERGQAYVVQ